MSHTYIQYNCMHINSLYCNLRHCHLTLTDCEVQGIGIGGTGDESGLQWTLYPYIQYIRIKRVRVMQHPNVMNKKVF